MKCKSPTRHIHRDKTRVHIEQTQLPFSVSKYPTSTSATHKAGRSPTPGYDFDIFYYLLQPHLQAYDSNLTAVEVLYASYRAYTKFTISSGTLRFYIVKESLSSLLDSTPYECMTTDIEFCSHQAWLKAGCMAMHRLGATRVQLVLISGMNFDHTSHHPQHSTMPNTYM